MLPILAEWFREAHVNLHQDKAEVHIRHGGGETKCTAANKGGEFSTNGHFSISSVQQKIVFLLVFGTLCILPLRYNTYKKIGQVR
jgi:hypothetical protein